jgi:hypothetical protein
VEFSALAYSIGYVTDFYVAKDLQNLCLDAERVTLSRVLAEAMKP